MSIAPGSVTSRKAAGLACPGGKIRRWLVPAAICLLLLGLFYTEENWRGKRTWEKCKRVLRTQRIALDWTNYLPAAIPDNQNIFGVPEMVSWFDGRTGDFASKRLESVRGWFMQNGDKFETFHALMTFIIQ